MQASYPIENTQLVTRWANPNKSGLITLLETSTLRPLKTGEILVEMLFVPVHGSFWLATHPDVLHPRVAEFMSDDRFVFGNGGVGRVVALSETGTDIAIGDYVAVFGHSPCRHYDCYGCHVLHRYTECDYGEGTIIGHGKHSNDGTYAQYAILPPYSWELCFRAEDKPADDQLRSYMFAFLFADVRNALTRHPDSLRMRRMLLIGGGLSGHIAAYIHAHSCPESQIFVVETSRDRADSIQRINPERIKTYVLPETVVENLNTGSHGDDFLTAIKSIAEQIDVFFGGRGCNLLFDCSSGNSTPLWNNSYILRPATHCLLFGFGSDSVHLSRDLMQLSGLQLLMSRGVGNIRNRREVIELLRVGAGSFVREFLLDDCKPLQSLTELEEFVKKHHHSARPVHESEHAYIAL